MDWAIFIAALIAVESGGNVKAIGDNGRAYGILQIHQCVVEDVNRVYDFRVLPNGTVVAGGKEGRPFVHADMFKEQYARLATVSYLRHYGRVYKRQTGNDSTPEVYARIHNGGPYGWRKTATVGYWKKVKSAMDKGDE